MNEVLLKSVVPSIGNIFKDVPRKNAEKPGAGGDKGRHYP